MSRIVGVLVDALFPPAADALTAALDEVGGRLLFGGGGASNNPLPSLALGVVARPPLGARSSARVQVRQIVCARGGDRQGPRGPRGAGGHAGEPLTFSPLSLLKVLLRPAPLDARDFFNKLPKLASAAACHASASPATAATTPADAEAGAAALKSFVGLVSRAAAAGAATGGGAAAGAPALPATPVVWVFGHAFGAAPATWTAALNALPPGITIKFVALPSGLPPASAASAGVALARFADAAVASAEAASLAVVRCDPASLRGALLGGLLRDLTGAAPAPVLLRLPAPIAGLAALPCLSQAELAPLAAPSIHAGGPTCPCHGAPVWVGGATPAYPAAVCPVSGRGVRLGGCALNPRVLRVGVGGSGGNGGTPITLAPTPAAAAAAADLAFHPPGGGVLGSSAGGWGGGGGEGGGFSSPTTHTLHVVACVPGASLEAGRLFGVPTILQADPLADEEEEEEEEEEETPPAPRRPPPQPRVRRRWGWGGPRAADPFAGPSSDEDGDEASAAAAAAAAAAPSPAVSDAALALGPAPGVAALAALCGALRARGDALVAAGRVDLLSPAGPTPTSLLRYYALRPATDAACLLVVGLAGDEERLPLSVVPPRACGGGEHDARAVADAGAALDAVRIVGSIGAGALVCGLHGRLAALAARCVATAAVVPPLPPVAGGGGGGGSGAAAPQPAPPTATGNKRRKPLAAAAALCMVAPAERH